jgi:hypothetical protein
MVYGTKVMALLALNKPDEAEQVAQVSPTLKKRRNLDRLSRDGQAARLTTRPAASSV